MVQVIARRELIAAYALAAKAAKAAVHNQNVQLVSQVNAEIQNQTSSYLESSIERRLKVRACALGPTAHLSFHTPTLARCMRELPVSASVRETTVTEKNSYV